VDLGLDAILADATKWGTYAPGIIPWPARNGSATNEAEEEQPKDCSKPTDTGNDIFDTL
jgi:hypothetical protein